LLIEDLLARKASHKREEDEYYSCHFAPAKDRQGIYIDYKLSRDRDWITLLTTSEQQKVQLVYSSNDSQDSINQIQNEINNLNLSQTVEMINRLVNS
jgi:hypothetical protein